MADLPRKVSRPDAYAVPADLDLRALARTLAPRDPTETALLAIRSGRAQALARRGERATGEFPLPSGFDVYAVPYGDHWSIAEEICPFAADVVVLAPVELRDLVVRWLSSVARTGRAA
jgi:proteasome accessory factor B